MPLYNRNTGDYSIPFTKANEVYNSAFSSGRNLFEQQTGRNMSIYNQFMQADIDNKIRTLVNTYPESPRNTMPSNSGNSTTGTVNRASVQSMYDEMDARIAGRVARQQKRDVAQSVTVRQQDIASISKTPEARAYLRTLGKGAPGSGETFIPSPTSVPGAKLSLLDRLRGNKGLMTGAKIGAGILGGIGTVMLAANLMGRMSNRERYNQ